MSGGLGSKRGKGRGKRTKREPRNKRTKSEPREHVVKMAELYRNRKQGKGKPSPCTGEVGVGGGVRSTGRSNMY